jgi:exopolyphosphatase/guanosine-5'-triphosphate,3'-diphosphate pyrophosphatase
MNIAIIDIGTNTFDLLIAKIEPGQRPVELYNNKLSVRLGAGGLQKHVLTEAAMERAFIALRTFSGIVNSFGPAQTFAFGTSALRDASNKADFVQRIKKEFDIDIAVIDGDKEAGYIYTGVQHALDIGKEKALIMDIGGGSIEFIIADNATVFYEGSFNIGVARLLEKFKVSDPIQPVELKTVEAYLEQELQYLFQALVQFPAQTLIGSSGSFDTFAEVIAHRFHTPDILNNKTEYTFNLQEYALVHKQLIASTLEDRKKIKGIIEMRLDMIVMAALVTGFILKKTRIPAMRLSTYSLKEGVLWELLKNQGTDPFKAS